MYCAEYCHINRASDTALILLTNFNPENLFIIFSGNLKEMKTVTSSHTYGTVIDSMRNILTIFFESD